MITTRTRALSILATVAMLVSMLACFVIPASAEADVAALASYQAVIADAESGTEALAAELENPEATPASLYAAAASVVLKSDIQPRYAHKTAYAAAGYTAKVFAISDPADWRAMIADSVGETFEGYTFHLTNDVDFNNVAMEPLNFGTGANDDASRPFKGAIYGHGYAFKNINVYKKIEASAYTGLIGKLGAGAIIDNFGVDSGTIKLEGNNYQAVAVFGEPVGAARVTKVWFGGELICQTWHGCTYGFVCHPQDSNVVIDGAYFYGTLSATNNTGSPYIPYDKFLFTGENSRNTNVRNAIGTTSSEGVDGLVKYNSIDDFRKDGSPDLINVFGVGNFNFAHNNTVTAADAVNSGMVGSVEEAAWRVNAAQSGEDGESDIYFTYNSNGDLRFGNASNRVVKVAITGTVTDAKYFNNGTTIDLAEDLGLSLGASTTVTINDAPYTESTYTLDGDLTIHVEYSSELAMAAAVARFEALNPECLVNGDILAMIRESAATAADEASRQAVISACEFFVPEVTTDPAKLPGYAANATYAAYNAANNWAIATEADWRAMVADSATKTFEGYTFYVKNDVVFEGNEMLPLNEDASIPFQGTINGQGYGFKNIYVMNPCATNVEPTGLIAHLGANARINNFGVDSGEITFEYTAGSAYNCAATFGKALGAAKLTNVWSGATIWSTGKHAQTHGFVCGSNATGVSINGAYFFGRLSTTGEGSYNTCDGFTILGDNGAGTTVTNALSAPVSFENLNGDVDIDGVARIYNNSNTNWENFATVGLETDEFFVFEGSHTIGTNQAQNLFSVESALEGAWKLNGVQSPTDTIDDVYFTINSNGDIRFGDASNKIVQVVITGDVENTLYFNNGATIDLTEDLGILYDAEPTVTIGGSAHTESTYTLTGDVTINVAYGVEVSLKPDMLQAVARFEALDPAYLSNGATLIQIRADAENAADNAAYRAVIDACEAFVPEVTTDYTKAPAFSLYETYKAYNTANNWAIKTADDWKAMMAFADASLTTNSKGTPNYFKGFTFHLTADVDFADAGTIGMMGDGKMFSGNINGHGYGFSNITVVFNKTVTTGNYKSGMIYMFEGVMQDFGINSGSITATSTGNGNVELGMIGGLTPTNSSGHAVSAKFLRVWNHAAMNVSGHSTNGISPLIGYHAQDTDAVINGFYSSSVLTTVSNNSNDPRITSGLVACNSRRLNVYNVVSDVDADYLLVYGGTPGSDEATANGAVVENVFTTDVDTFYVNYTQVAYDNSVNDGAAKVDSALEAAYRINRNPIAGLDAVYFTLKNGKLYPVAEATDAIIKATVIHGAKEVALYINKTDSVTKQALADLLDMDVAEIVTVLVNNTPETGDSFSIPDGAVIDVNPVVCDHENLSYEKIDGNTHTVSCEDCTKYSVVEPCDGTWAAGEVNMETGASAHTKTCSKCGENTVACNGTKAFNSADCTLNAKWVFSCGVHNAEYEIANSGNASHSLGAWNVDPADETKEVRGCEHCDVKEYRLIGGVAADNTSAKAGETITVEATLPVALTGANITVTVGEGIEIVAIAGEGIHWADGNTATAANTAANAVVTITLKANATAFIADSTVKIDVTDAISGELAVSDATITAEIAFTAFMGDATGDNELNLLDALVALYYTVDAETEINLANADVEKAEGDPALNVTLEDVFAIVTMWLLTV